MKKYLYVVVFVFFVFSCNNNDDNTQSEEANLFDQWSLVNVSGGLAGVDDDFETGLIIWDFNLDLQQITISNNNTTQVIYDGLPTGTYDFQILTTTGEFFTLIIDDNYSMDIDTLTNTQLILDEGIASDGFLLTFSKN